MIVPLFSGSGLRVKIIEGNKERIQFYEGTILAKKNSFINTTIIVRKVLQGVGVERVFLVHSPKVDSITVLRSSKVRRSKLYYLVTYTGFMFYGHAIYCRPHFILDYNLQQERA